MIDVIGTVDEDRVAQEFREAALVLADQSHQEIHEGEDKADEGDVEKRNASPADGKEGIHPPGIEAAGEVARDQKTLNCT